MLPRWVCGFIVATCITNQIIVKSVYTKDSDWHIDFSSPNYKKTSINYTTVVDPRATFGIWEGWGVSLCWWAHVLGKNETLADLAFSQKSVTILGQEIPGLGLNIVRYNLGASSWNTIEPGETRMSASPNIPHFKQIPGFWLDWHSDDPYSKSWDWTVDPNRASMLQMAKQRGANKFELFSNSPMWWMTSNLNPSGSLTGLSNNLEPWNFHNFTKYLVITAAYFKKERGIEFTSIEPFNEPVSSYWNALGTQEGCKFDASLQAWIIMLLRQEMKRCNLDRPVIAASDEWHYDYALSTWNSFNQTVKDAIGKVNVHGYQYGEGQRSELFVAWQNKTSRWMSEYGDGSDSGMEMVTNMNLDFRYLHPTAYNYWQIVDETAGWGMLQANLQSGSHEITHISRKTYVLAQYSRHIRPGMTMIDGGEANTVAAYDNNDKRLVLVTVNYGNAQWVTYNLAKFASLGTVTRWVTQTDADSNELYTKYNDVAISDSQLQVYFTANTIQTFEIESVWLTNAGVEIIV